jgi:hypothetical protein
MILRKVIVLRILAVIFVGLFGLAYFYQSKAKLILIKLRYGPSLRDMQTQNKAFDAEVKALKDEIVRRQRNGINVACSYQIYRELRWRKSFTRDTFRIRELIEVLKKSLESQKDESFAEKQDPRDGSWGSCFSDWFLKVWATAEHDFSTGKLQYPATFLDQINAPDKLNSYLESVLTNDYLNTGIFNRVPADDSISGLGRLILKNNSLPYSWHPLIKEAYLNFLDKWQDPRTGMWGLDFNLGFGIKVRTEDTGITFHILSQRQCQVNHLDKLARAMLALKEVNFPFGWKLNGHNENHMNMDAARNFHCAWDSSDEATRKLIAAEMRRELNWSLRESLLPSGEFKLSELDDTLGDAFENGVGFLFQVGYFKKKNRFWTDEDFPEAEDLKKKIIQRIHEIGTADSAMKSALSYLE